MDALPPGPSALLKTLAKASRWVFGLLLGAWLLLLLAWGALHLFIVPRIDELRPQLEARISQAVGVPVRIGAIAAQADSLIPSFELKDVRLIDPQGREALRLPRVLAALSPRSLWNLGFEQLYVESPRLAVRRSADGRIFVAGLDFSQAQDAEGRAADWFFSQTEFVIRGGSVEWTDELRGMPTLLLEQVDFVARNRAWTHAVRLDATPPTEWGERFTLMARMRQPLLSVHPGRWREWEGQLYADFARVDVARLRPYAELGAELERGTGALRAWMDVKHGQLIGGTVDVQLSGFSVVLGPQQTRLALPHLAGRLGARRLVGGFEAWTEQLQFDTEDGLRWPGGNLRVLQQAAGGHTPRRGELQGDRLDLPALTRIAQRLPLPAAVHDALQAYAPRGTVERIQASWQGELAAPSQFEAKGRVVQLGLAAQTRLVEGQPPRLLSPGVQGLNADFDFNAEGGKATLALPQGRIELPGWFEEPALAFDQLTTDVRWQIDRRRITVQAPNLRFSHADAQGELQLKWQTGEDEATRFPGVLDLQGGMSRAAGHRVYRYLPLEIPQAVRDYLRASIPLAPASAVRLRVKGDLRHFPFAADANQGEFRISAQLRDAAYAYLPRGLQAAGELPWPALTHFNGELLIDRASLQLKKVTARVAGTNALRLTRAEAVIPDYLRAATVNVQADARGPLTEMLTAFMRGSPLSALTDHVLDQTTATGQADVQFQLSLPLAALEKSTVQGKVTLPGNDVQLMPAMPRLQRARGVVHFSEKGFAIGGGQARMLGGEIRAEGGSIPVPGPAAVRGAAPPQLRISGSMTAEGLRQARELGALSRLAQQAGGSTGYTATLGWRRGAPEFLLTSNLQGLSLNLPAPLNKSVEATLPLRLEIRPQAGPAAQPASQDQVLFDLGKVVSAAYVRDLTQAEARVLHGGISIGLAADEAVPMPAEGVAANVRLERLDLDAWRVLLPDAGDALDTSRTSYMPSLLALRAAELTLDGRRINQIVAGGSREGNTWRVNLDAHELSGYAEYRPSAGAVAGRVYARLARLVLAPTATAEVEKLLDVQPESVPALDVVVGDLELRGKKLGRVEIDAVNRGARDWRLNKLNVILPEARFSAVGNWAPPVELGATGGRSVARRRTLMDFRLDISDAGDLLARLGMKDVIRKGHGKLEGQVVWQGSPLAIDYPTLGGALTVNVEGGQFLKADPGIAKLLGVLSLQALPRRLTLDFRDVFSEGFAFDFVRGDVQIQQGVASTNNLQMKGVNAAVLMEGRADIARETQDIKVVVVPEIGTGTASLITTWINPVAGLTSFLAQLILRQPLIESATQEFRIDGSWADPRVVRTDVAPAGGKGDKR